jgi:hypothetical protein
VGVSLLAGAPVSLGQADAGLDRPDGGTLALFGTSNSQGPEVGLSVHLARPVFARLSAEVAGGWSRTSLRTRITDDFEGAPDLTVREGVSRFAVEGAAAWRLRTTDRTEWFVRGGGGWEQEVTASRALATGGPVANFGAGVKYWWPFRGSRRRVRWGVRAEGRLATRWRGLTLDGERVHLGPVFTLGLIIGS